MRVLVLLQTAIVLTSVVALPDEKSAKPHFTGLEWCEAQIERSVKRSGDRYELFTSISMDELPFLECVVKNPRVKFFNWLVCSVHLTEHFPSNLVINQEELDELKWKYNYVVFPQLPVKDVNRTMPAEEASPFTLHYVKMDYYPDPDWIGNPTSLNVETHMPFELRHQTPAEGVTEVDFELPMPEVAIKCMPVEHMQEWDPIEARKHALLTPPHGVTIPAKGREVNPSTYWHYWIESGVWLDLILNPVGNNVSPMRWSLPVSRLPKPQSPVSPAALGVGSISVILILAATWKLTHSQKGKPGDSSVKKPASAPAASGQKSKQKKKGGKKAD